MKSAILSSVVAAGSVAAQITLDAGALNIAAIDASDPEFTTCSAVGDYVAACITAAGGSDALETNAAEFIGCACCIDATAIYPVYSDCSVYLSDEAGPTASDLYSAYDVMYSVCGLSADCSGGVATATATESESETVVDVPTSTTVEVVTSATEDTSSITAAAESSACDEMVGLYSSCSSKIDGFSDLPYGEQASCYCCRGSDGATWTDEMDGYASTCAEWAESSDSDYYVVAKTFATFCDNFSDACESPATTASTEASTTESSDAESTDDSTATIGDLANTDAVTVTVPGPTATDTSSSDSDNAAASVRVGCGAVLAAVAALALAL
ncbi:hypothetical protein G7Z17_g1873 [Cylindrodendrum hubeiense]|uniref:Uncharacterized protein n=1 Tax=Cylindrodendrum hubeiense TaxID=595255 RepID=A0A9P5LC54_9HYPO|nr:hypothetical protein G7Z17_g1873 [Cylindrodendrum hubeiense]